MKIRNKIIILLVVAILFTIAIEFISSSLMPIFGNDVALGQLENDDAYFIAMQSWHKVNNCLTVITITLWFIITTYIVNIIIKYIKNKRKEQEI